MKFFLFIIISIFTFSAIAQDSGRMIVVIDAGHGGKDPGNLNKTKGMKVEKEINLLIAKKLGHYIDQFLGHKIEVVYTRTTDVFIPLEERAAMANRLKAAYFISVHCNSSVKPDVYGTETHIHNIKSKTSRELGLEIEKQFSTRAGRNSRGLKLKTDRTYNLLVLKDSKMPAILVETGFMTNKAEEAYLNSDRGQDLIASAIFRGFRDYVGKKHNISMRKPGESTPAKKEGPVWKIQIMASTGPVSLENPDFKAIGKTIEEVKITNSTSPFNYKYYVGSFSDKREAKKLLKEIRESAFKDAYLVKFE
ncbi:MAG: N-acetylmuramoyl-L-alanine amidase [Flavobacteriales bacterium]|jgi:N-acetylmuramoyl-L-alanine amidase|nr:N-acetylmuramoyl-L-alanine amidase [Flavobacteriales bacterium]